MLAEVADLHKDHLPVFGFALVRIADDVNAVALLELAGETLLRLAPNEALHKLALTFLGVVGQRKDRVALVVLAGAGDGLLGEVAESVDLLCVFHVFHLLRWLRAHSPKGAKDGLLLNPRLHFLEWGPGACEGGGVQKKQKPSSGSGEGAAVLNP